MNKLLLVSKTLDPYKNQAIETLLFSESFPYDEILFLWVNGPAVVFGRNQNPWKEVNLQVAQLLGIDILRRHSGGGTVYHDWGNLNYAFITNKKYYDEKRNFKTVQNALSQFDIQTDVGSRKDIFYESYKISGSAFYLKKDVRLHHGTLLIDVDTSSLWDVLRFNEERIESRSIKSVKSEVINLASVNPKLSIEGVMEAIEAVYYNSTDRVERTNIETFMSGKEDILDNYYSQLKSWEWLYGETPKFRYKLDKLGYIDIKDGKVVDTPSLDTFEAVKDQPFNENKILEIYQREV